jgi:hypothetical protein
LERKSNYNSYNNFAKGITKWEESILLSLSYVVHPCGIGGGTDKSSEQNRESVNMAHKDAQSIFEKQCKSNLMELKLNF